MVQFIKKCKEFIFGNQQEVRENRLGKRKRDHDITEESGKRPKLEMNNIDSEEDVEILRTTSFADKLFSPFTAVRDFFSPSKEKKTNIRSRAPVVDLHKVVDLTQDEDNIQALGSVTKDDLNEEIQVLKHIHPPNTSQASGPTRLDEEEIQLLKVVNPKLPSESTTTSSAGSSVFGGFSFNPTDVQETKQGLAKRFRFVTNRERQIQSERNRPANLVNNMKSGRKPVMSRVLSLGSPRSRRRDFSGVGHCINMEDRKRYSNLLMRNTSSYLPGYFGGEGPYASLFGHGHQRSIFFTPVPGRSRLVSGTPGLDAVDSSIRKSKMSPGSPTVSPVFKSKSLIESSPLVRPTERKLSSLEEENKIKEVYSPGFIKTLNDKYSIKRRELDRKIRVEETTKSFHSAKNEELYEDVNDRILRHLKLTSAELEDAEEEEEEDVVLPEITAEMESVINSSLRSRDSTELVTAHRIPITGKDIKTLNGLNWLNDEVINFYMQMIVARGGTEKFPKVHAFSTFFYSTYRDNGYARIKRWTKKLDIFDHSMIFVPVHLGMHWCLAVIDVEKKVISYYDSMGGNNEQCTDLLFSYLKEEHSNKKGSPMDMTGWETRMEKEIPQQMNGSDCGMFSCKFAEYISRRVRISFDQQDMPYFRRRMVYEIVKNTLLHP